MEIGQYPRNETIEKSRYSCDYVSVQYYQMVLNLHPVEQIQLLSKICFQVMEAQDLIN